LRACFIRLIGDMDGREFTGAIESGQLIRIAPVGLDAIGRFLGNQRGRDDLAMKSLAAQVTAQDKPARPGFIDHAQFHAGGGQLFEEFIHGGERAADDAVAADFGAAGRRDGDGDGFLVDVQADIMYDLLHDFPFGCLVS
jgi:hypothetical protein